MATSVKQAKNRMNEGHKRALRRIAKGLPMFDAAFFRGAGDYRGAAKVRSTLSHWGTFCDVGDGRLELTEFGRDLLALIGENDTTRSAA